MCQFCLVLCKNVASYLTVFYIISLSERSEKSSSQSSAGFRSHHVNDSRSIIANVVPTHEIKSSEETKPVCDVTSKSDSAPGSRTFQHDTLLPSFIIIDKWLYELLRFNLCIFFSAITNQRRNKRKKEKSEPLMEKRREELRDYLRLKRYGILQRITHTHTH